MTYSPATPAKGGGISLIDDSGSTNSARKSASAFSSCELASMAHDPSPASTYGESNMDDNVPATPLDVFVSDKRPQRYVASISATEVDGQRSPLAEQSPVYIVDRDNSFTTLIEKLGIARITENLSLGAISGQSSPSRSTSFVLHGTNGPIDDPFTSSYTQTSSANAIQRTPTRKEKSVHSTPCKKLDSSTPESTRTLGAVQNSTRGETVPSTPPFSPREDRLGQRPSVDNAQAIFPPDACVFVANLSSVHTDEQLEAAVNHVFGKFGIVYTKIRRDIKGMPYAFCQYETKHAADNAIVEGKGKVILGRKCRTEIAKVQRALYVSKHNGERVDQNEVTDTLASFGAIESIFTPSETERELYHLPHGFWVRFAFFQDCRDAYTRLRDHPEFRFDQHQEPVRQPISASRRRVPYMNYGPSSYGYYNTQEFNPAIFVGNLPTSVCQDDLTSRFGIYGNIMSMQIIRKPPMINEKNPVYAFIEFLNPGAANAAIASENNRLTIDGRKLRVEKKDLRASQSPRRPGEQRTTLFNHYLAPHNNHLRFFSSQPFQPAIVNFQDGVPQVFPPTLNLGMIQQNSAEAMINVARTLGGNQPQMLHHQAMYAPSQNGCYGNGYGGIGHGNNFVSNQSTPEGISATKPYGSAAASSFDPNNQTQDSGSPGTLYQCRSLSSSVIPGVQHNPITSLPSPAPSSTPSHMSGARLNIGYDPYSYTQNPGYYTYPTQEGLVPQFNVALSPSSANSVDYTT